MSNSILFGNNSIDLDVKTNSRGFDISISGTNKEFVGVKLITKIQDEEKIYTSNAKIINKAIHRVLFPMEIFQKESIIVYQFKITVGTKSSYSQLFKRKIYPSQVNDFDDIKDMVLEKLEFNIDDFENDYIDNIEKYIKESVNVEEIIKEGTATHSKNGLMSFQDKIKLDSLEKINGDEFVKKDTLEKDLTDYAKKTDIPSAPDLSKYAKKSDIPPVPDLSGYAKKTEIPVAIANIINQKNGRYIKLWLGNEDEHKAVSTIDENTIYFVKEK